MVQFNYKVRDGRGEASVGTLAAPSREEAGRMLRGEGKFIVELAPTGSNLRRADDKPIRHQTSDIRHSNGGVQRREVIMVAHQLSIMVETGVPLSEALNCIAEQMANPKLQTVLLDVAEQVRSGCELSAALGRYPRIFPVVMMSLIHASELSGTMGVMLDRISQYLAKEHQTVRKIRGAMTYPAVMMGMVIGVTVFLLTFVMPRFAGIYAAKGATLPAPTRLLLAISGSLVHNWVFWLLGVAALGVALWMALGTAAGRRTLDYLKLHLPVLGPLYRKLYITRATRTMGTMMNAGVQILDLIPIARQVTANVYFDDLWDQVDEHLRQGAQLSDALVGSTLIPRSITQMIHAGEKAGRMGAVLDRIAAFTEEELDEQIRTTTQFIEPAMITIMGGIIGFVAIALLLPIFSISHVVAN